MDCRCKGIHRCEIYPVSIDLYANNLPPTLHTVQTVPPTLDVAQTVPPILDTAQKGTPYTKYRTKSTGFSFRVRSLLASCRRVALVGEAGIIRIGLAHWEKKWEGGLRRG